SERYRTAREMQEDLRLLQSGQSVKMKRAAARRSRIVKRSGLVAGGLALLTAAGLFLKGTQHDYEPKPEAVHLYQLGQWYYNQLGAENHRKAFDYLSKAIQADSEFISPYRELTLLYVWQGVPGLHTDEERWQGTKAIADKLLALSPRFAEGHLALSYSHFLKRDWAGAEAEILRAIKLNPKLPIPHYLYSYYLTMQLRTQE